MMPHDTATQGLMEDEIGLDREHTMPSANEMVKNPGKALFRNTGGGPSKNHPGPRIAIRN